MMARLPFDPKKIPPARKPGPARRERAQIGADAAADALSVTQLTLLIKATLADHTPAPLRVVGEVSNFSERGHWYLSLKDEQNVISTVMWASAAKKCLVQPTQGMAVVASGRLDYYGPQGKLQLYIDKLEPVGVGALELRFRQLCDELRAAGYFDESRKRPLPAFPERIAVVSSAVGAAIADVQRTAQQRWAGCQLLLVDVPVQGASAAPAIARAIAWLSDASDRLGLDAIIVTRGGGSIEDLWAFNERMVADAVLACRVPVVAAIGHEVDTTIVELVADHRASTPTQAATALVPDARAEREHLDQLTGRLGQGLGRAALLRRSELAAVAGHAFFRRPLSMLDPVQRRLTTASEALHRQIHQRLKESRSHLQSLGGLLQSIGPRQVLARGYTYTTGEGGGLIRSPADVEAGERLTTHLAGGEIHSTVDGGPAAAAAQPRRRPAGTSDGGLFDTAG